MDESLYTFIIAILGSAGFKIVADYVFPHVLEADQREFDQAAQIRNELRQDIDRLRVRIVDLEEKLTAQIVENKALMGENIKLTAKIERLELENAELRNEVTVLTKRVYELEEHRND